MKIKSKKGQTEDIFADFMIAVILIAIAIGTIGVKNIMDKKTIPVKTANELGELYRIDMITLMRTQVEYEYFTSGNYEQGDVNYPLLSKLGVSYGQALGIIADGKKEKNPWLFSVQGRGFGSGDYGFVAQNGNKCTAKLRDAINSHIPYLWQLRMTDESGKQLFWCSSYNNEELVNSRYAGKGFFAGCKLFNIKIPGESGNTATAEWGVCE